MKYLDSITIITTDGIVYTTVKTKIFEPPTCSVCCFQNKKNLCNKLKFLCEGNKYFVHKKEVSK